MSSTSTIQSAVTSPEFFEVLGVKISAVNLASACQTIDTWIRNKIPSYVCVAPVSTVVDCQDSVGYRDIVNRAGMVTPDGMPLVWIARNRGKKQVGRTYGPDLLREVCAYGLTRGYRHYFYGGSVQTVERLVEKLKRDFSGINVAGYYSPPLRQVGEMEVDAVIAAINASAADIIWVGLGSPKQDYWMHQHRGLIQTPVMAGVGAAFDFIAGTKPQAPRWMRRAGLEWLFRLVCEPRRLWRRYLVGNSYFLYRLLKAALSKQN